MKKKLQRNAMRIVAIGIIFTAIAFVFLVITLIAINYKAIGTALGSIPGAIRDAIVNFPIDWLIAGGIGAALAFVSCAIFWHWAKKPSKQRDTNEE